MPNGNNGLRITDGTLTFEGGIDSGRIPTIAGPSNPTGLKRNQLAWLTNGHCRGGGLNVRTGWKRLAVVKPAGSGLYQGGFLYEPDNADPYLMLDIAGRTYQVRVDTDNSVQDGTGPVNPATRPQHWFVQGENYLIIQDGLSEPLVWDGAVMKRISAMGGAAPYLPTGECMEYYMGRVWVAAGREYMAGDIVLGPSGTGNKRDSILHASENVYLAGGGKFVVPSTAGNIRAMSYNANLDTALGQGQLFVFTRKQVFATAVPALRADWILLKEPLQRVAQINYGTTSDRSIAKVNGDLFYRSMDGIRSLMLAIRNFQQWGNTPISRNENRVIRFDDRALLRYASGIQFDNRIWQTVLPQQTAAGVIHRGVMPLDFDLISSLEEKLPPVWEGMLEGLDILQMFSGDFGGLERAFGVVVSRLTGAIEVWEFTQYDRVDTLTAQEEHRISWYFETPAYTWNNAFALKQLDSLEIWLDKILSTVDFKVYYRVDQNPCWIFWDQFQTCLADGTCEDVVNPVCYPVQGYCEGYKATLTLPVPPQQDIPTNVRPSNWGYQFQIKVVIKGWCRVRGLLVHAFQRDKAPFEGMQQ